MLAKTFLAAFAFLSLSYAQQCPLNLEVYYETLCPDSKSFIVNQLNPAVLALGSALKIDLVPYGNAEYKTVDGKLEFTCEHGPNECRVNTLHACAKKSLPFDKLMKLVNCMESAAKPQDKLDECATNHGVDKSALEQCANGSEGFQLLKDAGDKTSSLNPKPTSIPTVTLNGVQDAEFQREALQNLKGALCKRCQGTKPAGC